VADMACLSSDHRFTCHKWTYLRTESTEPPLVTLLVHVTVYMLTDISLYANCLVFLVLFQLLTSISPAYLPCIHPPHCLLTMANKSQY